MRDADVNPESCVPVSRRIEPRIVDPTNHPRRYVSLRVAAIYLEVDPRTLGKFLDAGTLPYSEHGRRRRIAVADIVAFELARRRRVFHEKQQSAHTHA